HAPAARDHISHIGQQTVEAMGRTLQIIDQDRALDRQLFAKRACAGQLIFHRTMRAIVLARMRLAHIDKQEEKSSIGIRPRHRLKRWRRQRTVRSGKRAKLYHQVPLPPIITQANRLASLQQGRAEIRRALSSSQYTGESLKVTLPAKNPKVVFVRLENILAHWHTSLS